jgi:hypothetical protein
MGISRKTALKRIAGLSAQIELHLAKIREEPRSASATHWRAEVRSWIAQIETVAPSVGPRTAARVARRVIIRNQELTSA